MNKWARYLSSYLLGALSVSACANVVYKYYGLNVPNECYDKGVMLGKLGSEGWPDLPFTECKPDQAVKGKCTVQLSSEFFKQKKDLEECHKALDDCQHGGPPQ